MTYSIRRLSLSDMDRAAIVLRTAFDDALPWLSGLHTPEEDRAFFRNRVFVDDEVWGAIDGEIIGIIAFREGWIDQLYVLPGRQREGVGEKLLQVAKSTWPSLKLWTFQKNRAARDFYEKHGFAPEEMTDGSGNEEREPDVLYAWRRTG
ncbi:GNAT family N-acetyltransferase [Bauldia sp.]|uniref:GNAT family N-acetyltransferase n=1 Tax=Bauldia sp. TaxID=2575872 RepID=UPI003BABA4EB